MRTLNLSSSSFPPSLSTTTNPTIIKHIFCYLLRRVQAKPFSMHSSAETLYPLKSQCVSLISDGCLFILFLFYLGDIYYFKMLQTPKATVEVKELKVDISKDSQSKQNLFVKLHILPIVVHLGDQRVSCDQSSNFSTGGCLPIGLLSSAIMERSSAPFICEEFSLCCEFGHDRYCLNTLI